MKHPYTLSDSQLKAYADEHLRYEFDMLAASTGILGALPPQLPEDVVSFALRNGLLTRLPFTHETLSTSYTQEAKGKINRRTSL